MNDSRVAHTAEHIFMRALTKIKPDARVVKVEFKPDINRIYIKCEALCWEDVINASKEANRIIMEDRRVSIEFFNNLDEARVKYPDLRAYEERITPPVRIVIIENYDYAACKGEHVNTTRECLLFLPITLKSGRKGRYIVEFLAGYKAMLEALDNISLINDLTSMLKASRKTIRTTLKNLVMENQGLIHKLRSVTREYLDRIPTMKVDDIEVKLLCSESMDKDIITDYVRRFIRLGENKIFVSFLKSDDKWIIVSAASESLAAKLQYLTNYIFRKYGGKGGGRKGWVIGYVDKGLEAYNDLLRNISSLLKV